MAVFPRETHRAQLDAGDRFLRRYPVLAVALLVLVLGAMPGIGRNADLWRCLQPSGGSSETPHFAKREPLRALVAIERKESQAAHWLGTDGILPPQSSALAPAQRSGLVSASVKTKNASSGFWPAHRPRAPPYAA